MSSLSPLHTVGDQVGEALSLHRECSAPEAQELTLEMLRLVGFPDPNRAIRTYPFELSGGLRQRAMIAMALVCRPALLIARRADDRARRHHPGADPQARHRVAERAGHGGADDHPRSRRRRQRRRGYRRDVSRRGRGERHAGGHFPRAAHPYLQALLHAVPRFDMAPGERLVPLREIPAGDAPYLMAEGRPGPTRRKATRRPARPQRRCSNASISTRPSGSARPASSAARRQAGWWRSTE